MMAPSILSAPPIEAAVAEPPSVFEPALRWAVDPAAERLPFSGLCGVTALGQGRSAVVLADIAGRAVESAALARALRRLCADEAKPDLAEVVRELDRGLVERFPSGWYATLFLGIHDPVAGRLDYVGCAHMPPALLTAEGEHRPLPPTGGPLGLGGRPRWESASVVFESGDALLGAADAFSRTRMHGGERILPRRIVAGIDEWTPRDPGAIAAAARAWVEEQVGAAAGRGVRLLAAVAD